MLPETRSRTGADKPICVVGAGPVGLVTALRLAQSNMQVVVVERQTQFGGELKASTFHPPTLDMLDELNLSDAMIAAGLQVPQWQVRLHATHERAVFDLGVLADDTRHPFRLQYKQSAFCELAMQALRGCAGVTLRLGTEVTGVRPLDEGVRLSIQSADGAGTLDAAYVAACDGANSTLRRLLSLSFDGKTYPETTLLATTDFPFEEHLPGLSWVNYVWSDWGTFSLLRVPDRWRVSLYPEEGETAEQALAPESVQRKLNRIVPGPKPYTVFETRPYRIHQRILDSYCHGRVVFAGDAAHVNSPSGGMGMNCGIHDAFSLADTLADIAAGASPDRLNQYDRQRRPIARDDILKRADSNRQRMQTRDPESRRAELARLQAIAGDPAAAREFLLGSSMIEGLRKADSIA